MKKAHYFSYVFEIHPATPHHTKKKLVWRGVALLMWHRKSSNCKPTSGKKKEQKLFLLSWNRNNEEDMKQLNSPTNGSAALTSPRDQISGSNILVSKVLGPLGQDI